MDRLARIRALLEEHFQPLELEVIDDSALHRGHAGARDGRGHFRVEVVSARFRGLGLLARHRLVYSALADLLETDVHALSIKAKTPEEWA